ncbi:hypothetical protein ACLOJK_025342 [Asimina triloba]
MDDIPEVHHLAYSNLPPLLERWRNLIKIFFLLQHSQIKKEISEKKNAHTHKGEKENACPRNLDKWEKRERRTHQRAAKELSKEDRAKIAVFRCCWWAFVGFESKKKQISAGA